MKNFSFICILILFFVSCNSITTDAEKSNTFGTSNEVSNFPSCTLSGCVCDESGKNVQCLGRLLDSVCIRVTSRSQLLKINYDYVASYKIKEIEEEKWENVTEFRLNKECISNGESLGIYLIKVIWKKQEKLITTKVSRQNQGPCLECGHIETKYLHFSF